MAILPNHGTQWKMQPLNKDFNNLLMVFLFLMKQKGKKR